MRVIVTGATGSVGNGLVNELVESGYDVLVLTRKNSNRNIYIPMNSKVNTVFCSLEELQDLHDLDGEKFDIFYHLAWKGTTGSERDNINLQMNNVHYTLDAVNLSVRLGCHTFVGIGSQAECGRVDSKINSRTTCNPESAYGAAKLSANHMSRMLAMQMGMRHIWVRLLTVYGPYDGAGFVAPAIKKIHRGEIPAFTKGDQIWDFLYYKDAGKALRLLGEKGVDGKTYAIGYGVEKTLRTYITEMNNSLAPDIKFLIGKIPYSGKQVMYLCADNTEISNDVGWEPQTVFATGVRKVENTMITEGLLQ